jgi:beta-N-acetylhexosaminidase
MDERTPASPVILGCAGPALSDWERAFFRDADPVGFILFARNCESPEQVRALTGALRDTVGRDDAPVLIDQEGGRVARLRPPHWRAAPPARRFGALLARSEALAVEATRLNATLIALELSDLGITVDCAPVLDVPAPGAHDIVGDRAFSADPAEVIRLGRAMADGLVDGGVLPVIKHVPGHGRAHADSHLDLPVVDADRAALEAVDFAPFRALADLPCAMTAHVLYTALDPDRPATTSATVVAEVIRDWIGFDGLLISDDLSMNALEGSLGDRAAAALAAGCDIALHCNGDPEEMAAVVAAAGAMPADAATRLNRALDARKPPADFDRHALEGRLAEILQER